MQYELEQTGLLIISNKSKSISTERSIIVFIKDKMLAAITGIRSAARLITALRESSRVYKRSTSCEHFVSYLLLLSLSMTAPNKHEAYLPDPAHCCIEASGL